MRAEYHWRLRDALDPVNGDDICLPPGNEIIADLCAARYSVSSAGVIIEEKAQIKKRIGRSPDIGDAVMIALQAKQNTPQDLSGLGTVEDYENRWS